MEEKVKQRINLFLNPEKVKKAKIMAIEENLSLSQLIDKALDTYSSQCRCRTVVHNHKNNKCKNLVNSNDEYCAECHDKAADETMRALGH